MVSVIPSAYQSQKAILKSFELWYGRHGISQTNVRSTGKEATSLLLYELIEQLTILYAFKLFFFVLPSEDSLFMRTKTKVTTVRINSSFSYVCIIIIPLKHDPNRKKDDRNFFAGNGFLHILIK